MSRKLFMRLVDSAAHVEARRHAATTASAQVLGLSWYRHYPGSMLSTARGWSMATLGVFHALFDLQWDAASIPADPEDIRRLAAIQTREWRGAWPLVEAHFPIDKDGRRRNPGLAEQRLEAVGRRWQQIDAINSRHHGSDGAFIPSAETYLRRVTDVHTGVSSDEGTHQHQHQHLRGFPRTELLQSEEVGGKRA